LKDQQDKNDKNSSELEKQREEIERISSEVQRQSDEILKKVDGEKTSVVDENSTDDQIPSAKAVYDATKNVKIDVDDKFSSKSENPVQNKIISANVASAIKCAESGKAVRLEGVSPLEHDISVKVSKEEKTYAKEDGADSIYETDNMDNQGDWTPKSEGAYTVASVDQEKNTVTFTDGKYIQDPTFADTNNFSVGQVVWFDGKISFYPAIEVPFDYSTVTLTKYGKNLLDRNKTVIIAGALEFNGNRQTFYRDDLKDGTARGDLNTVLGNYQDFVGKTITISYDFVGYKGSYDSFSTMLRTDKSNNAITLDNGKQATFGKGFGKGKAVASFTVPKDDTAQQLIIRQYVGYVTRNIGDYISIENLQVEIGDTVTEWEEYKEPTTYTPNADGTVDGVTSLYPTTTLMTDTEGVTIEAEYNADTKKYIDKKFAELQALVLEV
jgi:hypothetical protein